MRPAGALSPSPKPGATPRSWESVEELQNFVRATKVRLINLSCLDPEAVLAPIVPFGDAAVLHSAGAAGNAAALAAPPAALEGAAAIRRALHSGYVDLLLSTAKHASERAPFQTGTIIARSLSLALSPPFSSSFSCLRVLVISFILCPPSCERFSLWSQSANAAPVMIGTASVRKQ